MCMCLLSHFVWAATKTDETLHVALRYIKRQLVLSDIRLARNGPDSHVSHLYRSDTRHVTTYSEISESVQQCLPAYTR